MKVSTCVPLTLLSLCAQMSQGLSIRRTTDTSTSGYLQIQDSSNSTLDNYWGYVDPEMATDNGVIFQFISDKSQATNFSIEDTCLAGFETGYVAGSNNDEGTPTGGSVYMAPKDLYVQGGEPILTTEVDSSTGVVSLSDTLGDGTVRNLPQACFLSDVGYEAAGLPVLVVGEEYFDSDDCANITLYWVPVDN